MALHHADTAPDGVKVLCRAAQTALRTSIKTMFLEAWTPVRRLKMLERLGMVFFAFVLAFAFAPYLYVLADHLSAS